MARAIPSTAAAPRAIPPCERAYRLVAAALVWLVCDRVDVVTARTACETAAITTIAITAPTAVP